MAATIRLTETAVAAVGEFGAAVQARLLARGATALPAGRPDAGEAKAMVLVSWRPEPALAELFDQVARERAIAWLPVVVEHPFLVAGPWVTPDGPCYGCYAFRRRQHDPLAQHRAELLAAYGDDDSLGVYGHLPHHVRAAEALTLLLLRAAQPGMTMLADLATMMLSRAALVGRHGCPRCGAGDSWGDPALAAVIAELAAEGAPG